MSECCLLIAAAAAERRRIRAAVAGEGYRIAESGGADLPACLQVTAADIVLVELPPQLALGGAGTVVERLRGVRPDRPLEVVVLGGLGLGLGHEADDFISRPYSAAEVRVRLAAARRRLAARRAQGAALLRARDRVRELSAGLQRVAGRDPLSGLLSRRALFERIDADLARARRHQESVSCGLIDVDDFKRINDTYGHVCGDSVIRAVGALMTAALRRYDYAGRYGGDEFLLLLQNTAGNQAVRVAERLVQRIADLPLDCAGRRFTLTVSIGVAELQDAESVDCWIERADRALYAAKRGGKNRVGEAGAALSP